MDEDNPIFTSGYRPIPVNYAECKKDSPQFWQIIRSELPVEELSVYDLKALNTLCSNVNWMDLLPKGLVSSYSYLYHCVKGLGCEDAEAIEKDVLRTVGAVKDGPKVFSDTSENGKARLARSMHRVLTSISIIDSMGYCQGMNYIVDFLLKMKSEEEAFSLFLYALRNKHLCSLYETKLPVLSEFMEIFELHLSQRLPTLSNHLKERGFIAPFYSIEWFTTLFTLASPFDLTVAVWDMFFAGVQDTQLRCGLAMMEVLEPLLLRMTTEELLKEFRYLCQTVTRDDVILRALRIQLSPVRVGTETNNLRVIDPKYKEERYTDTLLWLRAQYLNEAKTAMQERDIDNGRWVKQRKSEKYELRKLKYLEKQKREQESASSHDVNSENRQRNHSHGSDSINQIGSDQERLSHQSSLQETGDDVGVSGDFPDPSSKDLSDQPAAPDRSKSHSNDHVTQLKQLQSVDSSENDHHLMESHPDGVDEDDDDEDDQEDITTSYEVYFDFFVSPTLLLYANLLKTIIVKCDRITSWNLLNQIWLETLPHIKNNLAKYNFADHMLRYSIKSNAHLRVIQFFLCVGGSDPNSQDRWLRTPLHYAVVYNRPDVLRFLLLIGADSNVPGAICIPSGNGSSSMVNYNLYTPRELMINLNMSSSSPSMMILKERCCLWCQKLFQSSEKTTNQSSNGTQTFARAYCGLCTIPFCIQCIHSHKCVYSIDKYEYHKHYVEEYLHEVADDSSSQSSPTSQPALKDDLNANKDEADDETSPLAPELVDDNLHEYTIERIPQETETEFADDQSEIMNGRDSLDSGFGSADQLDVLNSEELVDDIEEYYGSDDEVVQSNEEEQGSTNPISLVKKFLGKTRKTTPVREETITVTEEVDLSAAPSKPSSIPLPWRRNSQVQTETEDIPNESGGKSMLSKARTLSIDLGMVLHGDKKEKKIEDLQTPNKVPPTEIKKKLGMSSIGDSLKKFTKGIGRSAPVHQPPEEVTSYLYNDEPVAKFTSDGIPFYWVGYQETQFIALQSWQILLLPIIYQTEKYYDTVQLPHLSPPQGNSRNETLLSPSSVGSSIVPSKQYFFLEDESAGAGPAGAGAVYDPHGVYPSPRIKSQSFHELNLELEQNQPRYLYFKSDISIYYSLLIKDAELLTVDTSIPTSNLTERSGGNNDRDAMESEVMLQRFASTNAEEMEENSVPIHEEDQTSLPLSPSTIPSRYQSPQPSVDHTSEIFAKHIKILKYIQSSAWSLHEGDSQWAPNDCAWYCRTCYSPFSLFQRKHHCRRCGEVFCDDHAPKVDILTCLPSEFRDILSCIPSSDLPDKKQLRMCVSCQHEMRECKSLYSEYQTLAPMYTFEFWLETLSKSSIVSSSSLHVKHDAEITTESDGPSKEEPAPSRRKYFKTTEVGLWMDTMADWIWRDRDRHPNPHP